VKVGPCLSNRMPSTIQLAAAKCLHNMTSFLSGSKAVIAAVGLLEAIIKTAKCDDQGLQVLTNPSINARTHTNYRTNAQRDTLKGTYLALLMAEREEEDIAPHFFHRCIHYPLQEHMAAALANLSSFPDMHDHLTSRRCW
jgi:hypothetical protein